MEMEMEMETELTEEAYRALRSTARCDRDEDFQDLQSRW